MPSFDGAVAGGHRSTEANPSAEGRMKEIVTRLGPWRVERTLGRDLSGTYYTARAADGERATLCLLGEGARGGDARRTRVGARAQVAHPSLVPLVDLGRDDGDPFLVGEPVDD